MLCRHCTDKQCNDIGTDDEPLTLECQSCDGAGCDQCDEGQIKIKGCPQKYCKEVVSAVTLIDLFSKGLPPIAGGALDQSIWFLEAAKVLGNEEALVRMEATQ